MNSLDLMKLVLLKPNSIKTSFTNVGAIVAVHKYIPGHYLQIKNVLDDLNSKTVAKSTESIEKSISWFDISMLKILYLGEQKM